MQRPSFATDPPVEHANASSDDVKGVIVTGSYSSDLHLSKQLLSPSLSSSVSTGTGIYIYIYACSLSSF